MAHATHPNYADRHEPLHHIAVNGGPVLKINTNLRYATDSLGEAAFRLACEQAAVPMQSFVVRTDLPCGSTVGPMTSALTGATTVDFGAPLRIHAQRSGARRRAGPGDVRRGARGLPRARLLTRTGWWASQPAVAGAVASPAAYRMR